MKKVTLFIIGILLSTSLIAQNSKEQQIQQLVESYVANHRFYGNVLIAKGKKVVFEGQYGYADLKANQAHTPATLFEIGSITKSMTAQGILKLEKKGRLKLNDPLSVYLPLGENGDKITVQQLLNHSSGLKANIFRMTAEGKTLMPTDKAFTQEELFEAVRSSGFNFEPGTAYEYNNLGYSLLAEIIEKASGIPYSEYMQKEIFSPFKMKTAQSTVIPGRSEGSARAYDGLNSGILEQQDVNYHPSWVKGAGYSSLSCRDLLAFIQAVQKEKIVSYDKLFETPSKMEKNDAQYGYGFIKETFQDQNLIWHNGGLPGYSAYVGFMPEHEWQVIILSNATSGLASSNVMTLSHQLFKLLLNQPAEPLATPQAVPAMQEVTGTYQLDEEHQFSIVSNAGQILLKTDSLSSWSLFEYPFDQIEAFENQADYENLRKIAYALTQQKWDKLPELSHGEMKKFVANSDQMAAIWQQITAGAGEFNGWDIYNHKGKEYRLRFRYSNRSFGLKMYLQDHKLVGMFLDEKMKENKLTSFRIIPTGWNQFVINGSYYHAGSDVLIGFDPQTEVLSLQFGDKTFEAKKQKKTATVSVD